MIHNDHLGTPQKMTDASGTVVWAADYKPFGEVNITTNTITNNLRFPGQYFDAETGNFYNYYRDYNPIIGRYLETDPLMLPFTYHWRTYFVPPYNTKTPSKYHVYLYVTNNPLKEVDLLGLSGASGGWGGGASVSWGPLPPSHENCKHYPSDSLAYKVCMDAGNNCWSNCTRDCLKQDFLDEGFTLHWYVVDHTACFAKCAKECICH